MMSDKPLNSWQTETSGRPGPVALRLLERSRQLLVTAQLRQQLRRAPAPEPPPPPAAPHPQRQSPGSPPPEKA
jgi:hypothetical protein